MIPSDGILTRRMVKHQHVAHYPNAFSFSGRYGEFRVTGGDALESSSFVVAVGLIVHW